MKNFFNFGAQLCEVIVSVSNFFIAASNHFANIMKVDNSIIPKLDLTNFFAFSKPKKKAFRYQTKLFNLPEYLQKLFSLGTSAQLNK